MKAKPENARLIRHAKRMAKFAELDAPAFLLLNELSVLTQDVVEYTGRDLQDLREKLKDKR